MLQFQHLFRAFFSTDDVCAVHYDIIYYPFPISSQYLKMRGVDSHAIPSPEINKL